MKRILSLVLLCVLCLTLVGCGNSNNENKEFAKTEIILIDNLDFEINSEVKLLSLIDKINNGEIISEDANFDTSLLGEKEIVIRYQNEKKEEKEYTFKINIIDTEKPVIEYKKELSTTAGTQIDLLKDVKVTDNSKEEIKATVDGTYDFNKEGIYTLKYVAIDSSGNKTEEEFILKVNKKSTSSNNNSSDGTSNSNSTPSISIANSSVNVKVGEWAYVSMVRTNLTPSQIDSSLSIPNLVSWAFNSTSATNATIQIYGKSVGTTVLAVTSKDGKASAKLIINVTE